jgi:hypothetical protein
VKLSMKIQPATLWSYMMSKLSLSVCKEHPSGWGQVPANLCNCEKLKVSIR